MHKKLKAMAAFAALTLAALASGGSSAMANQAQPAVFNGGAALIGNGQSCATGTDCAISVNHYRSHAGRHHRGGHRWHRRHWEPRYHRRHHRPHFEFYIGPAPHVAPRYRPAPRAHLSRAHINWCHNRYKSYRAWDNTYQPYHGPRRQCWSPYS